MLYSIWRGCERWKVNPPEIDKSNWEDLSAKGQSLLLAYDEIRQYEELQDMEAMVGAKAVM